MNYHELPLPSSEIIRGLILKNAPPSAENQAPTDVTEVIRVAAGAGAQGSDFTGISILTRLPSATWADRPNYWAVILAGLIVGIAEENRRVTGHPIAPLITAMMRQADVLVQQMAGPLVAADMKKAKRETN